MRLVFVLFHLALVVAQLDQIPSCANPCEINIFNGYTIFSNDSAGLSGGVCPSQNEPCICALPTLWSDVACCALIGDCDATDKDKGFQVAWDYCVTQQSVTPTTTNSICPTTRASAAASAELESCQIIASIVPSSSPSPWCSVYEAFIQASSAPTESSSSSTKTSSTPAPTRTGGGASSAPSDSSPSGLSTGSPPPSASSSNGLSTGAKAGIAVGAVAVFIAFAIIIFLLDRRSKKKRSKALEEANQSSLETGPPLIAKPELDSTQVLEAPSGEKGGKPGVAELEGSRPIHHESSHELGSHTTATLHPSDEVRQVQSLQPLAAAQDSSQASGSTKAASSPSQPQANATTTPNTTSETDDRAANIAKLEEEERRIDEMIAETEHLQALRQRKLAVRQQLEDAKVSDVKLD